MNASQRLQIFSLLSQQITEPKTELKYRSHFQLLIAVILSAQATDISVNRATRPLFRDAPNPKAIRDLGVEGLTQYIRAIGLFNTKAKNIISIFMASISPRWTFGLCNLFCTATRK